MEQKVPLQKQNAKNNLILKL